MADYDIPAKRNFALFHAARNGYRRIGLLDDDITLTEENLRVARTSLACDAQICSFYVLDCPDVSTIDHIERIARGIPARVSIGGNCLFFDMKKTIGFFPRLYNDDWFFIFSNMDRANIVSGGIAEQRPYTPWRTPRRVEFEQLGDAIIEGAKFNIMNNKSPFAGGRLYWDGVLEAYRQRLAKLSTFTLDQEMLECLERANTVASEILAESVLEFLGAYMSEINGEKYAR